LLFAVSCLTLLVVMRRDIWTDPQFAGVGYMPVAHSYRRVTVEGGNAGRASPEIFLRFSLKYRKRERNVSLRLTWRGELVGGLSPSLGSVLEAIRPLFILIQQFPDSGTTILPTWITESIYVRSH